MNTSFQLVRQCSSHIVYIYIYIYIYIFPLIWHELTKNYDHYLCLVLKCNDVICANRQTLMCFVLGLDFHR